MLFNIVINLKILQILRSTSIVKLFVYKTVKCEVTNVEFFTRDLPLNNSAIMVKWKCLKLLYSSKGMDRIDTKFKKSMHTFFSIFSWYFSFIHLSSYHLCFQVLRTTTFPFLAFLIFLFLCVCFYNFKKEHIFKYFQHLFNIIPS